MNKNDHLSNHPRGPSPENPFSEGGLSKEEYEQYKALLHLAYPQKKTAVRENVMAQIAADRKKQKIRRKIARYGALAACFLLITAAVMVASPLLRQVNKTSAVDNAANCELTEDEETRSANGRQSSGASSDDASNDISKRDAMYCNSLPMFTSTDSSGEPETAMEDEPSVPERAAEPADAIPEGAAAESEPDLEVEQEITAYSLSPDDVEYPGEGEDALLENKSAPAAHDDGEEENAVLTSSRGAEWVGRDERPNKADGTDALKTSETMAETEAEKEAEVETRAETLSLEGPTNFLSSIPEESFAEEVDLCGEALCGVHTASYHTLCGSLVTYVGADEVALWRETAQSEEACGVLSVRDFVEFFGIDQNTFQELVADADAAYNLAEIYPAAGE